MTRSIRRFGGGRIAVAISAATVQAQDAILGQTYGNGVHAYFAGDYVRPTACSPGPFPPVRTTRGAITSVA